jgi:hypothetical protein
VTAGIGYDTNREPRAAPFFFEAGFGDGTVVAVAQERFKARHGPAFVLERTRAGHKKVDLEQTDGHWSVRPCGVLVVERGVYFKKINYSGFPACGPFQKL